MRLTLPQFVTVDGVCQLIDEIRPVITPTVLGQGRHLFADDGPALGLQVIEATTTPGGLRQPSPPTTASALSTDGGRQSVRDEDAVEHRVDGILDVGGVGLVVGEELPVEDRSGDQVEHEVGVDALAHLAALAGLSHDVGAQRAALLDERLEVLAHHRVAGGLADQVAEVRRRAGQADLLGQLR